jgi:hypothetical protein
MLKTNSVILTHAPALCLLNVECFIQISLLRNPGFSRIRRSRQASHWLKPGLPVIHIRTIFSTFMRQM